MVADEKIFDLIPLKKEVKATISGIYITDVRGVRGSSGTAKTEGKVLPENEKQNRKKRQIKLKNGAYFPVMDDKLRFLLHCISINNWSSRTNFDYALKNVVSLLPFGVTRICI